MAGLAAAARAAELGLDVRLLEKGDRPGGSMRLSSASVRFAAKTVLGRSSPSESW